MISPAYLRTMAAYNAELNRRIYAASARLPDVERRRDRGAFFGSIHATLSHLLWADGMWMARLAGWTAPADPFARSAFACPDFADMARTRAETDARIEAWAADAADDSVAGTLTWFSGAAGKEITAPRALVLTHVFNHQTHHRGQVHAMLTAAGESTGATDLLLVL